MAVTNVVAFGQITEKSSRRRNKTILHIVLSFNSIALVTREKKRAQTSVLVSNADTVSMQLRK